MVRSREARSLGRSAEGWRCPECGISGQTWLGHEDDTDLAAHQRMCHDARDATPRDDDDGGA